MKIIVLSHDLDQVMRHTFDLLKSRGHEIMIAGPGQEAEMSPITSKFTRSAISSLRQLLKRERPEAVFCASTSGLSTALFATLRLGVRVIGYRGTQARVSHFDPTNYLALLNPRVSRIVCETPDIVDILSKAGVSRSKLTFACKPYSLDWAQDYLDHPLSVPSPEESNAAHPIRLILIGHCQNRPHKGLQYLIEAMKGLPQATLTVIGKVDPEHKKVAGANVVFLGPKPEAPYYLPGHDVLMLPSTRDASPRTVREAQACGLPCIVSDIPGARDLIIPGVTGLLVPAAAPQAIIDAVSSLTPEKIATMGKAARQHIKEHFDVNEYVSKIEQAICQP